MYLLINSSWSLKALDPSGGVLWKLLYCWWVMKEWLTIERPWYSAV
jgi:hypothetical protein